MRLKTLTILAGLAAILAARCYAWRVVGAAWRPDANPWAATQPWDGYIWSEGWAHEEQFFPEYFQPAGSIHLVLINDSKSADSIELVQLDGKLITDLVTTPQRVGRVVWYRLESPDLRKLETPPDSDDPTSNLIMSARVEPEKWASCDIRLRSTPSKTVALQFRTGLAGRLDVEIPARPQRVRIESVSFSARIDRIFVYLRPMNAKKVGNATLYLDGRRAPAERADAPGLALLESKLDPAWEPGSHHLIEVRLPDGTRLAQVVRARDNFFVVGLYGVVDAARVKAAREHGINTYFTAGVSPVLEEAGMNCVPRYNVGEHRRRTAGQPGVVFYNNQDEPDAKDWSLGSDLPVMQRVGVDAMHDVLPTIRRQRGVDPPVLNLLVVDNTYKPLQWYVYGQIPDVFVTDPYVPLNGRQVEYVYHALDCARDACAPRPMIPILWACGLQGARKLGYRPPTPEEERIMAGYAIGCGAKGLVYFIDMSGETGEGKFLGLSDNKPLWEEVGRINRDALAIADLLAIGCPIPGGRSDRAVWVRSLMCGSESMVVVVVNNGHYIGFETNNEFAWNIPARNVKLQIAVPDHLRQCTIREVTNGALVPRKGEIKDGQLNMTLDVVDTARIFVLSRAVGRQDKK